MADQFNLFPIGFSNKNLKHLKDQIASYKMEIELVECILPEISNEITALIIDCDKEDIDIQENLSIYQELLPGRPIIGLNNASIHQKHILTLKKPFNRAELQEVLSMIKGKTIESEHIVKKSNSVYSAQNSFLHYPVKNCFQESLIKTWKMQKKINEPVELVFLSKPVLVIEADKVYTLLSDTKMQQLCRLTINDHSISTALLSYAPSSLASIDATYFIAKVVLWSSSGRLPEGVDSTDVVRLIKSEVDCFLPEISESQLIQKFWSMNNCSLQETEQILQVKPSLLYSYFSVLYALDLIEVISSNPPSGTKSRTNKKSFNRGWLGKFSLKKRTPQFS